MAWSNEDGRRRPPVPEVQCELSGDEVQTGLSRKTVLLILASGVVLALVLALVLLLPEHLLHSGVDANQERLLKARSDLRGQLLQAVGALFFLVTAVFSWRQLRINQETLARKSEETAGNLAALERQSEIAQDDFLTDRFSRSIEQLANESVAIRLGGLYVLMRLAGTSDRDQALVADVLATFVRGSRNSEGGVNSRELAEPLRRRAPDIHAALSFLSSKGVEERRRIVDLSGADLRGADLLGARLARVDMASVVLDGALMTGANLVDANLDGASLNGADLTGARLDGTNLHNAHLVGADLTGASLDRARVVGANFWNAIVDKASVLDLRGADEAVWPANTVVQGGRLVPAAVDIDGIDAERPKK